MDQTFYHLLLSSPWYKVTTSEEEQEVKMLNYSD